MSGVELAGIVLGAIPLIISALEHYEDGLGKVKAFWKWEDELSNAIRQLWYQYTSYELTIRVLLSSVLSDVDVEAMMSNASSLTWSDPDTEKSLKSKLSSAYAPYLHTISDIQNIFSEIANSLNLDRHSHMNQNTLQAIVLANPRKLNTSKSRGYQFAKRIKFTMKKQRVKKLLEDLARSVTRLDSFNDKTEKLEPYRNNRKTRFVLPLLRLQQYASTLHAALHRLWTASGHSQFMTNLLLEQRLVTSKATKSSVVTGAHVEDDGVAKFTLSISDPNLEWTMAEVHVTEPKEDVVQRNSRVKIAISPSSPPLDPESEKDVVTLYEIEDLRSSLQRFQVQSCPTFLLEHGQGKLKGVYPSRRQIVPGSGKFIHLSDLLSKERSIAPQQEKLTKEQSYMLAVTLSSSLLQLHATPWLADRWSKRDIVFQDTPVSDCHQHGILAQIRCPYIGHVCSSSTCDVQGSQDMQSVSRDDSARLLDLAIMLLEIYFNAPVETFYSDADSHGLQSELKDFGIVKQWISREKGNLSWAFQSAVTHCLRCFADPSASLRDPDFCQGVIDQVLTPLQDELSILFNGPTRS